VTFSAGAQRFDSDLTIQSFRVALNYQFGEDPKDNTPRGPSAPESDRWSVHGQTTFVQQYAFPFRAPFHGPNSLAPNAGREIWDVTFYLGWKLWPGAQLWINPEIDQGFGLSNTVRAARVHERRSL
jgi:high affinity Mn2+ porin